MNLVLIGLPGSGKTTVGKLVAQRLGMPFADCDDAVVESEGKSIAAIFALEGETWFRQVETRCLRELLGRDKYVIATGGGIVLAEENRLMLKTAKVVFLDRTVDKIMLTFRPEGRPLMASHTLQELSEKRRVFYLNVADHTVDNKGADAAVEEIVNWWREQK